MKSVFIGMPVFNGEEHLREALASIVRQSFGDWTLLISDNCSTDRSSEIARSFAQADRRIRYFRQPSHIPGTETFQYVLSQADCEFFMWAADDDVWSENFISSLLEPFEENERIGLSFCEIANIDRSGNIVRRYPSFKRFESRNHIDTIVNFLRDPEILGKANLIYSLYRTALIRQVYERHGLSTVWGSDMIFVFACLCIADLRISEKLMFYKRVDPEQIIEFRNPDEHVFPYGLADEYTAGYVEAAHGTIYENVARVIMGLRKELLNKSIRGQDADKTGKVRKLLEIAGILRKKI